MKTLSKIELYSEKMDSKFLCDICYEKSQGAIALWVVFNGAKQLALSRPNPKKNQDCDLIFSLEQREWQYPKIQKKCIQHLLENGKIEMAGHYEDKICNGQVPYFLGVDIWISTGKTYRLVGE